MPSHSTIGLDAFHYKWSKSHKPAISISDGDTVTFEINDVATWQLTPDSRPEDLKNLDASKLYPLAGPVFVEGAKPGDALVIETVPICKIERVDAA